MQTSGDSFAAAFIITGFAVTILGVGTGLYFGLRDPSPAVAAAHYVDVFFRTADQRPPRNAWMSLHENTRRQFPLEAFETLVQTHPVFGPFESFEVDDGYDGDGSDVSGEIHVTGDTFRIIANVAGVDDVPKLVEIQVDGRSLFGVPVSSSGTAQN